MISAYNARGKAPDTEKQAIAPLAGWNADSAEAALGKNQFTELKNWRHGRLGEPEIRSGYKRWNLETTQQPVAVTEYQHNDLFRDIVIVWGAGTVTFFAFNPVDGTQFKIDIVASATEPKVAVLQDETEILVTVYDIGTYRVTPTDETLVAWNTPVLIGKAISSTPSQLEHPVNIEGDLFVFDNEGFSAGKLKYRYAIGESEPMELSLDVKVKYTLASEASIRAAKIIPLYVFHSSDGDGTFPVHPNSGDWTVLEDEFKYRSPRMRTHLMHRGFVYRFVVRRRRFDIRGTEIIEEEAASADFYVADRTYAAPFIFGGKDNANDTSKNFPVKLEDEPGHSQDHWSQDPDPNWLTQWKSLNSPLTFFPNEATFLDLVTKYRAYFKSQGFHDAGPGVNDPYVFAAYWLTRITDADINYDKQPPYMVGVPVSKIKGAPMVKFDWQYFDVPADAFQIDVFRTAHTFPDESRNLIDSPNFDWYRFGKVGTIEKDGTFTDDVKQPNFGDTPLDYEGYLAGNFSGGVMGKYNDQVVLGDIVTKHETFPPAKPATLTDGSKAYPYCHAFDNGGGGGHYNRQDFLDNGGDGKPKVYFGLQYHSNDGTWSDITEIFVDTSDTDPQVANVYVAFVLPKGYSAQITSVMVWEITWNGTGRDYKRRSKYSDPSGFLYLYQGADIGDSIYSIAEMKVKRTFRSVIPGGTTRSEVMNHGVWPQKNFLLVDSEDRITGMGEVFGQMYVLLLSHIYMMNFKGKFELVSREIGCVSRWACLSVDKVLVFLSAGGLYLVEGSGVRPYPGDVQSEVLKYLREYIPSVPPLENAKRASLGWLKSRQELWLYFPMSFDLGTTPVEPATVQSALGGASITVTGANDTAPPTGVVNPTPIELKGHGDLMQRIFVYKMLSTREAINYEFDLKQQPPHGRVLFSTHADGKLFAAYCDTSIQSMPGWPNPVLYIQDNDFVTDWPGRTYLELPYGMGIPELRKRTTRMAWTAEAHASVFAICGMMRADGIRGEIYGRVHPLATRRDIRVLGVGDLQTFSINGGTKLFNGEGRIPLFRLVTEPDASGRHYMRLSSVWLELTVSGG